MSRRLERGGPPRLPGRDVARPETTVVAWLQDSHPVWQALLATSFTWAVTALGASFVFFTRRMSRRLLDAMLGFSGGVMIAASYWSLLAPAIESARGRAVPAWAVAAIGFLLGGACLWGVDRVLPHLHLGFGHAEAEGRRTTWQRSVLLVLAITMHNIPEGLAVGIAFGGAAADPSSNTLPAAVALAMGIGIQNFPEGFAVAMPLRREGMSRIKSFWYGQLSAVVEPIAGVAGALAVVLFRPVLPYALAFAAGAMIFVVVEELIPESHRAGNVDLATLSLMVGFTLMMILDVGLV
jgi:ZIP family zinc transporter